MPGRSIMLIKRGPRKAQDGQGHADRPARIDRAGSRNIQFICMVDNIAMFFYSLFLFFGSYKMFIGFKIAVVEVQFPTFRICRAAADTCRSFDRHTSLRD